MSFRLELSEAIETVRNLIPLDEFSSMLNLWILLTGEYVLFDLLRQENEYTDSNNNI